MAGLVLALLGCQSAPPPAAPDRQQQKAVALKKLGFTPAADAWELNLGVKLLFESNVDKVPDDGRAALVEVARTLSGVGIERVIVEGHTDNVGSAKFNEDLSLRRAESVAQSLAQSGMKADAIELRGSASTSRSPTTRHPKGARRTGASSSPCAPTERTAPERAAFRSAPACSSVLRAAWRWSGEARP